LQQIIATDPLTDAAAGLRGPALGPKRLVMDGHEARRRIKADPALRLIPIFAVTSYALSGEEQKARAAGCDEYVPKPYSPRQLLAKIRQYLP
jgi:two-component system, cell cycle response regulator DivK